MGDLRNKVAKELRDEAHRRFMAKHHPKKPDPEQPKCLCGFTYYEVVIQWEIEVKRWPRETGIFCPSCIPDKYLDLVIWDVANLPEGE